MKEEEMKIIADFIKQAILDKNDIETIRGKVIEFRKNFQEVGYSLKEKLPF